MTKEVATTQQAPLAKAIENVLINGDLSNLSAEQKITYYNSLCNSLGLNPLTKPFNYLVLSGKHVLYATKDCAEQLRKVHGVSITDLTTQVLGDSYIVRAKACDSSGRVDCSTGIIDIRGLSGDKLCNAIMKAETKAKRRVTLSICGLGILDESEIDSIPGADKLPDSITATTTNEVPSSESEPLPKFTKTPQNVDISGTLGFGKHSKLLWSEAPQEYLEWMTSDTSKSGDMRFQQAEAELARRAIIQDEITDADLVDIQVP